MTSGEKYAAEVFAERFKYDGFNLIVGDARTTHAHWVGNRGEANARTPLRLEPGRVYGLANEVLDSPWPKVTRGKANMEAIMRDFSTYGVDELPALALEERVLQEVLHAPLDAAPPRRARRPATPPREETSRDPTRTVRFEQSIAHASLNDAHDDFEVDIDEDDEETVELVVEQVGARERVLLRPSRRTPRPSQLRHAHESSHPHLHRRPVSLARAPLPPVHVQQRTPPSQRLVDERERRFPRPGASSGRRPHRSRRRARLSRADARSRVHSDRVSDHDGVASRAAFSVPRRFANLRGDGRGVRVP